VKTNVLHAHSRIGRGFVDDRCDVTHTAWKTSLLIKLSNWNGQQVILPRNLPHRESPLHRVIHVTTVLSFNFQVLVDQKSQLICCCFGAPIGPIHFSQRTWQQTQPTLKQRLSKFLLWHVSNGYHWPKNKIKYNWRKGCVQANNQKELHKLDNQEKAKPTRRIEASLRISTHRASPEPCFLTITSATSPNCLKYSCKDSEGKKNKKQQINNTTDTNPQKSQWLIFIIIKIIHKWNYYV